MISLKRTKGQFKISEAKRNLAKKRTFIKMQMGVMAKTHFIRNFKFQGFVDETVDPWEQVKRRKRGTKEYARAKSAAKSRAILVKTGLLRRSITILGMPGNKVIIGTRGVRYAKRHNEGLDGMPQRQFIGRSSKLEREILKKVGKEVLKIWG